MKFNPNCVRDIAKSENETVWKNALSKGIFSIPSMFSLVNSAFELFNNIKSNI